jgi:hypothetical protein
MSTPRYRVTLLVCVVSWLLLGLHLPGVRHQLSHHGGTLPPTVIALMVLFALTGSVGLLMLLRFPWSRPTDQS